jgi:hypothetical protein
MLIRFAILTITNLSCASAAGSVIPTIAYKFHYIGEFGRPHIVYVVPIMNLMLTNRRLKLKKTISSNKYDNSSNNKSVGEHTKYIWRLKKN